jgi:hypothetical protein
MDEQQLKSEVLTAFDYCYLHDSWVNPLEEALAGIGPEEALRKPGASHTSIWEIVLHLAVWNENIVERIRKVDPPSPSEGHWPPLPPIRDKAAWERAKSRLWKSLDAVRTVIEDTPMDGIQASRYGLGDLFCRFTHIGYHLGQITKMREFMEI